MGDVRELARECAGLMETLPSPCGTFGLLADVRSVVLGDECQIGGTTGVVRHAVEVECEWRGWGYRWHCGSMGHHFEAVAITEAASYGNGYGETALECALHTLKWLLENPVEVSDG